MQGFTTDQIRQLARDYVRSQQYWGVLLQAGEPAAINSMFDRYYADDPTKFMGLWTSSPIGPVVFVFADKGKMTAMQLAQCIFDAESPSTEQLQLVTTASVVMVLPAIASDVGDKMAEWLMQFITTDLPEEAVN